MTRQLLLTYDLNYYISSYIYQCIHEADPGLARWLHNTGLEYQGRRYKPFVFSKCYFPSKVNLDSVMKVKGTLSFQIDSILPEVVQQFMEGAWAKGHLDLLEWKIPLQETKILSPVSFRETMVYRALSSIVVPIQKDNQVVFCHPLDSRFYDSLRNSLKNWYFLRWKETFPEGEEIHLQLFHPEKFRLKKAAAEECQLQICKRPSFFVNQSGMRLVIFFPTDSIN